jgi:2-polyprenyl-3-methyl-5-hydroxy-6-metoxy-1,4-benzoquinol methylase
VKTAVTGKGVRVVRDEVYGYWRLDPVPESEELRGFYESQYYDLIRRQGRAPELRRFMTGGEEAERERAWLRATLYSDICYVLDRFAPGKRVLDVGSGIGEFVAHLAENGFEPLGIEPSGEAVAVAEAQGRSVRADTLEGFVERGMFGSAEPFDAVSLLNVLEHVPDPVGVVGLCKTVLSPGGLICIRVPNDFSEMQQAAQRELGRDPWWIVVPDHINYFDFRSLHTLLERLGLEVLHSQGDFPMELFLLMGDDYVGAPEVGGNCHQKRRRFEMSLPGELRRRVYRSLGDVGVGRNCLVFARLQDR